MTRRWLLSLAALGLLAAADVQQTPAPAPAPTELTLEQFLGQRGWSPVQLRENAFSQLEADVLVNGEHKLRVQISTSFSKTIFDEAAAKQLGLTIEPTNIELTGANKQRLGSLALKSMSLGGTSIGAATVFTADLKALLGSPAGVEPVQGVIGSDLLTKYQAVLEIPNSKLYLRVH